MKIRRHILLPLAFLYVITGCTTPSAASSASEAAAESPVLGDSIISAMQHQDYACFIKDFSAELKDSITEAAFQKLCRDLADKRETIDSWKLLDTLDRSGLYHTEVWKIIFLRSAKQGKVRTERLFYVTGTKLDGRVVVIGFRGDPLF